MVLLTTLIVVVNYCNTQNCKNTLFYFLPAYTLGAIISCRKDPSVA